MENLNFVFWMLQIAVLMAWGWCFFFMSPTTKKSKIIRYSSEVMLSVITLLCFYVEQELSIANGLFPNAGFSEYRFMVLTTLGFFWLARIPAILQATLPGFITRTLLACFFWLSLLTSFKFIILLPAIIFPFYGLLIAAPFFTTLMSGQLMYGISKTTTGPSFTRMSVYGIAVLLVVQLIMNTWTGNNWAWVALFNPLS